MTAETGAEFWLLGSGIYRPNFIGFVMNQLELRFTLVPSGPIPVDHGHALYGAIKDAVPDLGQVEGLGIHPLRGTYLPGQGLIFLETPRAFLSLRLPLEAVPMALGLAGRTLRVHHGLLQVGACSIESLFPSQNLWARTVTRKFQDVSHEVAKAKLEADLQEAYPGVKFTCRRPRSIRIHQKQILGFEVLAAGLNEDESLRLQREGFGGRRAFGCGLFVAVGQKPNPKGAEGIQMAGHGRA